MIQNRATRSPRKATSSTSPPLVTISLTKDFCAPKQRTERVTAGKRRTALQAERPNMVQHFIVVFTETEANGTDNQGDDQPPQHDANETSRGKSADKTNSEGGSLGCVSRSSMAFIHEYCVIFNFNLHGLHNFSVARRRSLRSRDHGMVPYQYQPW